MRMNKKALLCIILTCSLFLTNIVSAQTVSNSISNPSEATSNNSSNISDTTINNSSNADEKAILENKQRLNEQVEDQSKINNDRIEENIVSEVIENREEYSKHFKLETGTYIAVSYTEPVNYLKDGKWEEIDNTLTAGTDKDLGDVFQNKSNSYKATFSKSISSSRLVTMQKDQYSIAWSLNATKNSRVSDTEAEVKNSNTDEKNLTNNEKKMDASKGRSIVTYKSVLPDIDLRYTVAPEKIKEDIVINKASSVTSFIFDISAPGLKARLNEDDSITFFNPDNPEMEIFYIPTPYMMDSSEEETFSEEVNLLLTETKDGYELEITPDVKWINASERVFPIYIDPTTYDSSTQSSATIADTYVHPGDYAGDHRLATSLRFGKHSVDGITRTYIKTNLPTITGTVFDAKLNLSNTGGSSTFNNVDVYRVDTAWGSSTLTWNIAQTLSQTLINSSIPVSYYVNSPSTYRYSCDITDTVQEFYSGARTNNGFMVKYTNETINDYNAVYSSDCGMANVMPVTVVSYAYGETTGITNGATYFIKNKHSGQYLDVAGAGTANSTNVLQWPFSGATNQQWKAIYQGNGLYKFQAMHTTDKYLELAYNSNYDGTNIDIFNGDYVEQYWSIQNNTNGSYRILSNCSNMTKGVTVENASTSSGANVYQYTYSSGGEDNDDWVFNLISGNYTSVGEPSPLESRTTAITDSNNDYNSMTWSDRILLQDQLGTIYTMAEAMSLIGGCFFYEDVASDMIDHFLSNQGTDYTVDYSRLISESSIASERHDIAIENVQNGALPFYQQSQYLFYSSYEIPYTESLDNSNWYHGINLYAGWITCEIISSNSLTITNHLRDFYNWDKNIYSMGNMPVSPHQLWLLHNAGYAKQYQVFGEITMYSVSW